MNGESSWNLHLGGIGATTTEADLIKCFSRYCKPLHCQIIRDKGSGKKMAFGFLKIEGSISKILLQPHLIKGSVVRAKPVFNKIKRSFEEEEFVVVKIYGLLASDSQELVYKAISSIHPPMDLIWFEDSNSKFAEFCFAIYRISEIPDASFDHSNMIYNDRPLGCTITKHTRSEIEALKRLANSQLNEKSPLQFSLKIQNIIAGGIKEEAVVLYDRRISLCRAKGKRSLITAKGRDMEFYPTYNLQYAKEFKSDDQLLNSFVTTYRPRLNYPRIVDGTMSAMKDYLSNPLTRGIDFNRLVRRAKAKKTSRLVSHMKQIIHLLADNDEDSFKASD